MILYFINDDEETIELDLIRYERNTQKEVCHKLNYVSDTYKLFVRNIPNLLETFLKRSYDVHVYIYFDDDKDGRVKKFFSPSIELNERYIRIQKLISKKY